MQENITSNFKTFSMKRLLLSNLNASQATRVLYIGIFLIIFILVAFGVVIFSNLPVANAFNIRVEQLFLRSHDLPLGNEIKLLEILAGSGTAFSDVLSSYRLIIFKRFIVKILR